MTIIRVLLAAGAVAFAATIFWAMEADGRQFPDVLAALLAEPWTIVTLVDLYLGFLIGAVVIFLVEQKLVWKLFWALPTFVLGNGWIALWLIFKAPGIARRFKDQAV